MRQLTHDEIDAVFQNRQGDWESKSEKTTIPFDFQKADRIAKSQLRTIRFLHDNFVLTSSLSAYLRAYVSGNLVSIEQIPYSTFQEGLPPYTCMVSLSLLPYGDNAMLEINPSLIFRALELLLGGKGGAMRAVNREITEMERHLLANLFGLITSDLEQAWKGVDDVEFRIDSPETKRRRTARELGPTEPVVAIGMEFRIDDCTGMINLAIPSITIKGMVQKFDQRGSSSEADPNEADRQEILKLLGPAAVAFEPRIVSRLSVRDLLALKTGSLVLLDHATTQLIVSTANGKVKFEGEIICEDDQRAFLIANMKKPD